MGPTRRSASRGPRRPSARPRAARAGRRSRSMPAALASRRHRVADLTEAIELCYAKGWTDGLPVVPPTPDRVEAMLAAARLRPDHEVTYVAHRAVSVTAEKVAINAVMAGCRPEYMPVVA